MLPYCVRCGRWMTVLKNDYVITERAVYDMKMRFRGDLCACPVCGYQVVSGFGNGELVTENSMEKAG
jgi:hypothetical protein